MPENFCKFSLTLMRFAVKKQLNLMADLAQLVRALVCGTRCREFESHNPPHKKTAFSGGFFVDKYNAVHFGKSFCKNRVVFCLKSGYVLNIS